MKKNERTIEFYMKHDENYQYKIEGVEHASLDDYGLSINALDDGWFHIKIDLEKIKK